MSSLEDHYPSSCPFCKISNTYAPDPVTAVPKSPDPELVSPQCHLLLSTPQVLAFLDIMPIATGHILLTTRDHFEKLSDVSPKAKPKQQTQPGLWSKENAAFAAEGKTPAQALGFWMPLISRALTKALGVEDWNVVQNNGVRAAQVVPHVHFHFIPRYQEGRQPQGGKGKVDVGMLKSWKMFGRGSREDLDDEEAAKLSTDIRKHLQVEVDALSSTKANL